ncbi:MAG: C25 family cysteine peptidase [Bacteroidetes bacterium]|nr:C25 family cysteine peptidase [Bacteroidota bacterium]
MKKNYSTSRIMQFLMIALLFPVVVFSGNIQIKSGRTNVSVKESTYAKLILTSSIAGFSYADVNTTAGMFSMLAIEGLGNRNIEGAPSLPVYHKLIEVPVNATFSVRIIRQHYQEINLKELGLKTPVIPAQPPMSKGDDPFNVPFVYNKEIYETNGWIADKLATVNFIGTMRALNLARVDISPVQYNPVENKLRIYDVLEVEVIFGNADISATLELKQKKASPYFNSLNRMVGNFNPLFPSDGMITSSPVTYVIVSDVMFQSALQPFIAWKKKKGFKVIEGYTNNSAVGTTTTSIKAWLQGLYNTPPAGYNAPSFVLFVGDVAQIPAWAGGAGSHFTDLRYCEYTGDNLPEVYYGRFSATSVAQLQPQIDKTLEYEKYLMPDPSFLGKAVMAAGADASYETYSNGQINYGTENYFNAAHGITSYTYLQPEPAGGNYSSNIKANVSAGVAYANYTAHCSESGWASPSFQISDVANLTNAGKYCLMVGNCCLSCKFDVTSFAEEQLRAANKGSVGYIGGSNNTYWDEDYWWGCGFKNIILHPAYDANHIGAYDGAFHDHGETTDDWFVTQGQMVVCGNLAVEESSTSRKQYYWEIYHLMGDPSLMIYYSVPSTLTASYPGTMMLGMSTLEVNTVPYAYIALSMNGTLLDARCADATGAATLSFAALGNVGTADIVITKQNKQPHTGTIQVIPASGPYVVSSGNIINDPIPGGNGNGLMDFGEINLLNTSLKNVGVIAATGVIATLSSTSALIAVTDNTENFGTLDPGLSTTINDAFSFTVANNIPDQQVIPFVIQAVSGANSWNSNFNITANAPVLQVGTIIVQDNGAGCDNDGILDAGETANILIVTNNNGHAGVSNVIGTLSIVGGTSPYLVINTSTSAVGTLAAGGSGNAIFSVTADAATPIGTPVDLNYSVSGGAAGQYSATAGKQVVIGLIPAYIMSNTTVTACTGYFYDSGGPSGNYQNNENLTETFYPTTAGSKIRAAFTSFSTESGYDYLKIYDGINASATLIGSYHGTAGPGTVTATNAAGALTFVFTSDVSLNPAGWAATISCYSNTDPPAAGFSASPTTPLVAQTVTFTDLSTNSPASWAWSFSPATVSFVGGTSPSSPNPQVQFPATGLYTVTLTVTNPYGADTEIKTNYINVTNCTIAAFPFAENFENGGIIPNCWSQEYVTTPGLNYAFITGNGASNPGTAHGGSYNACLKDNSSADNKTRLISPKLNLSNLPQPQLKFWHTQPYWSPDQDQLLVYYKTSSGGTWTLLNSYLSAISSWTLETMVLPNPTADYYIAFEGNAKYGYGVCIDDVEISSACTTIYPVEITIIASDNPVMTGTSVTFTASPANGGNTPAFQWKLNGTNIPGATSSTYSYSPENGNEISCQLTSDLSCASGNPAMSNTIVMTVTAIPITYILNDMSIGETRCFDAIQTITVAGEGHAFTVTAVGHVTMIAGRNILYMPGTTVVQGGTMYGYIAPEGPFCPAPNMAEVVAGENERFLPAQPAFCQVYPNPTTGLFHIELKGFGPAEVIRADIFDMTGLKVMSREVSGNQTHDFSLTGRTPGIYMIRLTSGSHSESIRIVKQN